MVIPSIDKKRAKIAHLAVLQQIDYTSTTVFYTDGSQGILPGQKDKTNAAAIVQVHETRPNAVRTWHLGAYVEVADAELFAIQQALQATIDGRSRTERVFICSDSQAAIQRLSGWNPLAVKARSLAAQLAKHGKAARSAFHSVQAMLTFLVTNSSTNLRKKHFQKLLSDS